MSGVIQLVTESDELPTAMAIRALEMDERLELPDRGEGHRSLGGGASVAVDHRGIGEEDDLATGFPDPQAPVRVVPPDAPERPPIERPGHAPQRGAEQLAGPDDVQDRAGPVVGEVRHQMPLNRRPVLEEAPEGRSPQEGEEQWREAAAGLLHRAVVANETRPEQPP